jgi:hypothetical protein
MLEEAEKTQVAALDAVGVKQLILSLEKKINRNTLARAKYADQPARCVVSVVACLPKPLQYVVPFSFLESEVELDEELKRARVLAAAPEQFPEIIKNNWYET